MKNIVVLTGAGISAESGISTFRDSGGLWEGHRVEDVASPEGWHRNKQLVLDFYNLRRADVLKAQPNAAHIALVELAQHFNVNVITQNVDDLHERAGSKNVLHLHGEILKVRSQAGKQQVYEWRKDLHIGDKCELGSQLRPHIVWFGEAVPEIENAIRMVRKADICIVIGTSMVVYPSRVNSRSAKNCFHLFCESGCECCTTNAEFTCDCRESSHRCSNVSESTYSRSMLSASFEKFQLQFIVLYLPRAVPWR